MKTNIKNKLIFCFYLVLLNISIIPAFSAGLDSINSSSSGAIYTNTNTTGNISGQIENAQSANYLEGNAQVEYTIEKTIALVLFDYPDTGSAPSYPAGSPHPCR